VQLKMRADGAPEDLFQRLDDTCFNLLVFGQPNNAASLPPLGDLVHVYAIPVDSANDAELKRAQIPQPSTYLLRPDGYIGLSGVRLERDEIVRYLSEQVGVPAGK